MISYRTTQEGKETGIDIMSGFTNITINTNGMVLEIELNISDTDGMELTNIIERYIANNVHPSRISKHYR